MSIAELRARITELVLPLIAATDGFLVDVNVHQEGKTCVMQVFFDTDEGVRIEQCAEVSRELNRAIEMNKLIDGEHRLEVSSPGIDVPLKLLRQYKKNVGREYRVRYRAGTEAGEITGIIAAVEGNRITFQPEEGEPLPLEFESIIESTEVLPW